MKKNLISKIGAGIAGLAMLVNVGCATIPFMSPEEQMYGPERANAMKILRINDINLLDNTLRNDYYATIFDGMELRTVASIMAGTMKVKKTKNGYIAGGKTIYQFAQQNYLDEACEQADTNHDHVITSAETENLLNAECEAVTRGQQYIE